MGSRVFDAKPGQVWDQAPCWSHPGDEGTWVSEFPLRRPSFLWVGFSKVQSNFEGRCSKSLWPSHLSHVLQNQLLEIHIMYFSLRFKCLLLLLYVSFGSTVQWSDVDMTCEVVSPIF